MQRTTEVRKTIRSTADGYPVYSQHESIEGIWYVTTPKFTGQYAVSPERAAEIPAPWRRWGELGMDGVVFFNSKTPAWAALYLAFEVAYRDAYPDTHRKTLLYARREMAENDPEAFAANQSPISDAERAECDANGEADWAAFEARLKRVAS